MNRTLLVCISMFCAGSILMLECSSPSKPKDSVPTADLPRPDVSSYQPALTDPEGTTYAGDYFPFVAGNRWNFSGQTSTTGYEVQESGGESDSTPIYQSGSIIASFEILPARPITFTSGTYQLNPIKGYTQRMVGGSSSTTIDTASFFEKVNGTIYCRGMKFMDGSNIEFTDRILLKQPLSAGASWDCQPQINAKDLTNSLTSMLQKQFGADAQISVDSQYIQGKAVVIGKTSISAFGKARSTIKVCEKIALKISLHLNGVMEGTQVALSMCMQATYLNTFHFARDTGWIAKSDSSGTTTLMHVAAQGQQMTVRQYENESNSLTISSVTLNPIVAKRSMPISPDSPFAAQYRQDDFSGLESVVGTVRSAIEKCLKKSAIR